MCTIAYGGWGCHAHGARFNVAAVVLLQGGASRRGDNEAASCRRPRLLPQEPTVGQPPRSAQLVHLRRRAECRDASPSDAVSHAAALLAGDASERRSDLRELEFEARLLR